MQSFLYYLQGIGIMCDVAARMEAIVWWFGGTPTRKRAIVPYVETCPVAATLLSKKLTKREHSIVRVGSRANVRLSGGNGLILVVGSHTTHKASFCNTAIRQ
jgi:hypothetical protein